MLAGAGGTGSHWKEAEARARHGLPAASTAATEAHRALSKKAAKPALHRARRAGDQEDCRARGIAEGLSAELDSVDGEHRGLLHDSHLM